MKKLMVVIAVLAMVVALSGVAMAGSSQSAADAVAAAAASAVASANQAQYQAQNLSLGITTVNNAGNSLGRMPEATTHQIGTALIPMTEYGHLSTQFDISGTAAIFCGMNMVNFKTMVDVADKKGEYKWRAIQKDILSTPYIRQRFSAIAETSPIYFPGAKVSYWLMMVTKQENIVGAWVYDTRLSKKNKIQPTHLQMQAFLDASEMGANIVICLDQFSQGYFVPEGVEFSLGAVLSWVGKTLTGGGSVGASGGIARQQNTEYVRPGAVFLFLHWDNPGDLCSVDFRSCAKAEPKATTSAVKPAEKKAEVTVTMTAKAEPCATAWISDDSEVVAGVLARKHHLKDPCPTSCWDNQQRWSYTGDYFFGRWKCTGDEEDLRSAIYCYDRSYGNFVKGSDTHSSEILPKAKALVRWIYRRWGICKWQLEGEAAAKKFAAERSFDEWGVILVQEEK